MLNLLRQKKGNWIIQAMLFVIIVVFIAFFGPAMDNCAGEQLYAAKVNGHTISDRELAQTYSRRYRDLQGRFQQFNREMAQSMKLRETTLDQLINGYLVYEDAEKRGLSVDDATLAKEIIDNPVFAVDGRFDKNRYEIFLDSQQLVPSQYEAALRQQIMSDQIVSVLQGSVTVSDKEARLAFEQDARSLDLEFIRLSTKPYEGQVGAVTEADATKWMERPDADTKIQAYYAKFKRTKYDVPKQIRARHILIRAEANAPPQVKNAARQRAVEAHKLVTEGMDFAEAAKKFSEDSTKDRGGDLGFFGEGQMVAPFEQAAFALKPGEVSRVVETPFGYHVIKLEETKAPVQRKLEDVKLEIAKALVVEDKAADLAKARAQAIFDLAKAGKSLSEVVLETAEAGVDPVPLKADTTGAFTKRGGTFVPKLGADKDLSAKAWALTEAQPMPDGPIQIDGAWIIMKLKERIEPNDAAFAKVKQETIDKLAQEKASIVLDQWAKGLRDQAEVQIHPLSVSYDDNARQAARGQTNFGGPQ